MNIGELPHRIIQTSKSLTYKELDSDIKNTIAEFELEYSQYVSGTDKSDEIHEALLEKSKNIGEYIYNNYVDHGDDGDEYTIEELEDDNDELDVLIKRVAESKPIDLDEYNPTDPDEKVLHALWLEDVRVGITREYLGKRGFNIGFWTRLGKYSCTVGRYYLERKDNERGFKLKKIK